MDDFDFNTAFKEHQLCPNCFKKTPNGIDDYKNRITGKVTKTCKNCRDTVLKAVKAKPRIVKKKMTMKQQNQYFKLIMSREPGIFAELENKYPDFSYNMKDRPKKQPKDVNYQNPQNP